jgi:drug/metabolite transporter (DMT)-like permease
MNAKKICGIALIIVGAILFIFSGNMKSQAMMIQNKMNMVEGNANPPPAVLERPANRIRQAQAQAGSQKSLMIGERTLDQYIQLINIVQLGAGLCIAGGAVLLFLGFGKKQKK